jgi:O-antigen/teichoic acid export membrane protein
MNSKIAYILDYRTAMQRLSLSSAPLYRNSLFMAFTSLLNAGSGFFFWIIAARLYEMEEVGLTTAIISYLGLIVLFSRLGFDFSIIRFFSTENKAIVYGTSLIITTIASLLIAISFISSVESLTPSLAILKKPSYSLLFILIVIGDSVSAITGRAFVADRKADHYFFQNIFMSLRVLFLIPLSFLGAIGIFCSLGFSYLITSFFGLIIIRKSIGTIGPKMNIEFIRKSFKFSSWNYVSNVLSIAPTMIIPLMVINILGEAEAAKYYIAFAIANLVFAIPISFGTSLFVEGSHGEALKKSSIRAIKASLCLLLPVVLIIFFFGDLLLGLLREEYIDAFGLLRLFVLSSFFVTTYSIYIPIENVRMNVENIVKLNAIRCTLLLILSYLFIKQFGILGIGYGWIITYIAIALWIGCIAWKERWV